MIAWISSGYDRGHGDASCRLRALTAASYSLDVAPTMMIVSLLYLFGPRGPFVEIRRDLSLPLLVRMIWTSLLSVSASA